MPKIRYNEAFERQIKALPKEIQKKARKAIRLLASDPKHPSLRSKPVKGAKGVYEASLDMHYRMTYERLPGDVLRLRAIGLHDEVLKKP